jgi:hypothetical protein
MLKERKWILLNVWAQLVLIHDDEVRFWPLANQNEQIISGKTSHLIQQRLNERSARGRISRGNVAHSIKQRLVFIEREDYSGVAANFLCRACLHRVAEERGWNAASTSNHLLEHLIESAGARIHFGVVTGLADHDLAVRSGGQVKARRCLATAAYRTPKPNTAAALEALEQPLHAVAIDMEIALLPWVL